MDTLRSIPAAVRWVSCEPLLEDISADINLDGFGWVVVGGESGSGKEYLWKPDGDWKAELKDADGRRTMKYAWAAALRDKVKAAGLAFVFKQVTGPRSGYGCNALDGKDWHEFPPAPNGKEWAPFQPIPEQCKMTGGQWQQWKYGNAAYPFPNAKGHLNKPKISPPTPEYVFRLLQSQQQAGMDVTKDLQFPYSMQPSYRNREQP